MHHNKKQNSCRIFILEYVLFIPAREKYFVYPWLAAAYGSAQVDVILNHQDTIQKQISSPSNPFYYLTQLSSVLFPEITIQSLFSDAGANENFLICLLVGSKQIPASSRSILSRAGMSNILARQSSCQFTYRLIIQISSIS